MLQFHNLIIVFTVLGVISEVAESNVLYRVRRQSEDGRGEIIDNIFNIPITAIKQTAAAAQSIYPEGGSSIDTIFNIPVATLEAVGNLVKTRNSLADRRPMDSSADIQKRRKERKDRLQAHRKGQRLQQQQDPFGVNALTDLLVGHHSLFSGHGLWGGNHGSIGDHLGGNWGSQLINHFGGHGSSHGDGDSDEHDSVEDYQDGAGSVSSSSNNNNGYEVTETVDEDRSRWGGWFDFGNFFGGSSSGSKGQNKVTARPDRRKYGRYDDQDAPLENKIAPKYERTNYSRNQVDRSSKNQIVPKNERRNYQRNYQDPPLHDRVAPRRDGRDRIVFEHRSL